MSDWITLGLGVLKEVAGLGGQVAENKGDTIPLRKDEIQAKSNRRRDNVTDGELIEQWKSEFNLYKKLFPLDKEMHAKNQIERLVVSGHEITSIDQATFEGRYCVYIRYIKENCSTWYRVVGKKERL